MTAATEPHWPERPALFLDLDGTVLEFADAPDAVVRSRELDRILDGLGPSTGGAIAFITGRNIAELDRILAPHRFAVAGVHGLERRRADGAVTRVEGFGMALTKAKRRLDAWARRLSDTLVEDKALSVAFHFRKRPELAAELAARFGELAAELDDDLEVLEGDCVYEIKPRDGDKGRAIEAFMREPPFAGRTPVFVGDDVTDEAGFRVVNSLDGVSVKVGDGPTAARARLGDVDAVLTWLAELTGESKDPTAENAT